MADTTLFERTETMNAQPKQEIVEHREADVVALHEPSIMEIISHAATIQGFDVDKLERLIAMKERAEDREAKSAFTRAMVKMKPDLPIIDRKGRITIHEKNQPKTDAYIMQSTPYALWEDIDAAITPILTTNGFALTFKSGVAQDGKITVTGILSHKDGHSEETTMTLPHDSSGSKNAVQAVGSSTSYGKRYTATLLLNLRTKGEDDDGQRAPGGAISEDECDKIFHLIKTLKADTGKFCKYFNIQSVPDLPKNEFERAIRMLNEKAKAVNPETPK